MRSKPPASVLPLTSSNSKLKRALNLLGFPLLGSFLLTGFRAIPSCNYFLYIPNRCVHGSSWCHTPHSNLLDDGRHRLLGKPTHLIMLRMVLSVFAQCFVQNLPMRLLSSAASCKRCLELLKQSIALARRDPWNLWPTSLTI